jgi:Rrf2 family transcriptional regulator, nitric oxide-sensitive transcriptional repressor
MRLSVQTDYALRTLMFLAAYDGQHSIAAISERYGISKNHLMKVAQRLVAEGFVKSVRGRAGGLLLNQPADKINVGHVVRLLEGMGGFVDCFDATGNGCVISPVCGLQHVLADSIEAFLRNLDNYTIADVVGDREKFRIIWAR